MKKYILPESGIFFKSNLHCHTTLSDGRLTPAEVKEHYKGNGYSIVAYSDHNILEYHEELNDTDFLALAAYEVDMGHRNTDGLIVKTCHLNGIAVDPYNAHTVEKASEYRWDSIVETVERMAEAGFLVTLNHPAWSNQDAIEIQALGGHIFAMEVYNSISEVFCNCGDNRHHYDSFLKSGKRAFAIAADDNHHPYVQGGLNDMCMCFTMIKAPALTYDSVIVALINGDFYASCGPEVYSCYIDTDRNVICVDCSPVKLVLLKGSGVNCIKSIHPENGFITHAEFDLSLAEKEPFVRLELVDEKGRGAYINPCYFDRLV